ncbi:Bestrophin, RFP-TM, chloride channel-domain-containing protein [Aspergillus filifer]
MRLNFTDLPTPSLSRQTTSTNIHGVYGSGGQGGGQGQGHSRHHSRSSTHPHLLSSRKKPRRYVHPFLFPPATICHSIVEANVTWLVRRWPLVFRFIKGAIHGAILVYVVFHAVFTAFVIVLDKYVFENVGLPNTIIPSLSIVVGLMLVFRNQTSYNRFWDGRNGMTAIHTSIRNLVRVILTNSYSSERPISREEREDVERTIRILMAIPYAVKNHLRAEWGAAFSYEDGHDEQDHTHGVLGSGGIGGILGSDVAENGTAIYNPSYATLLPHNLLGYEDSGLGLPYELTFPIESFIKRGVERGWFHAPGASQLSAQLNALTTALGSMETIRITPIPVAHLIHQKQVLALYGCVLPFAMVDDMGWWTIPIVSLVIFTLYGIEGIGSQLEDPFGYDRNDIKMDALVGDARVEVGVCLGEWGRIWDGVDSNSENGGTEGRNDGKKFVMPDMFLRERRGNSSYGHVYGQL